MKLLDFRRMKDVEGRSKPDWLWHPYLFNALGHGGWCYLSLRHPIHTLRWWWRFLVTVPRSRGWRWD